MIELLIVIKHFSAEKHTLIAKFYGFHGVQVPFGDIIHMVVMANVLDTNLQIHEVYDLKVITNMPFSVGPLNIGPMPNI